MSVSRKSTDSIDRLPDPDYVSIFIEDYIGQRLHKWNIGKDDALLTSDTTSKGKIEVCKKILAEINNCKSFEDWVNVAYLCSKLEDEEKGKLPLNKRLLTMFGVTEPELLPNVIHATMSYILSRLDSESVKLELGKLSFDIQQSIKSIEDDQRHNVDNESIKLKQAGLKQIEANFKTLSSSKDYYKFYYNNYMNKPTKNSSGDSFDHFAKNMVDTSPLSSCKKLLAMVPNEQPKSNIDLTSVTIQKSDELISQNSTEKTNLVRRSTKALPKNVNKNVTSHEDPPSNRQKR